MGCYPVFFFTIVIFLVLCCQKHIPLLHSALYCLHPLHSRFIQSFLCMYWFLYLQFSRCGLYKNRCWCMQKCHRNSSTGSTFAIFSWFLYWKMCDRLATIRIWCYTCSCSENSIDSFVGLCLHMEWYWRIIQKIDALASVGLLFLFPTILYERLFDSSTGNIIFSVYFCSPLFICDTYLTHVCMSLYLSMK